MNDDWARFCEMMAGAGWEWREEADCFIGFKQYYVPKNGRIGSLLDWVKRDEKKIGDWRTWLEAGQTPPPFQEVGIVSDYFSFTVILEKEASAEGLERIMDTVAMIKGVARVEPGESTTAETYFNRRQIANEVADELMAVVRRLRGI